MKRKDLVVGLDVAVKDGWRIYRAYILELDTKWTYTYFAGYEQLPLQDPTRVAIASLHFDGTWRPQVIKCRQVLAPWSDYTAQLLQERDEQERVYKAATAQRTADEQMRSRCAELLKITVQSPRLGVAEVQLNDLYAIACAMEKHTLPHDDTDQPSLASYVATDSDRAK